MCCCSSFIAVFVADQRSNIDINSINEFIYIPDRTNCNNLDVVITDKNVGDPIIKTAVSKNDCRTNENVLLSPSSESGFDKNNKINIIQHIRIPTTIIVTPSNEVENPTVILSNNETPNNPINQEAASAIIEIEEHIMEPSSDVLVTKKGKTRKRRTISMPLDERKKAKKDEKRKEYNVKPPCSDNCRRQCIAHIPENRRIQINDEFWNLSWNEQRQFILNNTQRLNVKRHTNIDFAVRKNTFTYHMKNESGTTFQICKPFFLTTLGFKPSNDKVVQNTLNTSINNITFKRDMRGLYDSDV